MSQIDVYTHELCGELLGLPVYRVLEQVPDGEYCLPVGPDKLLVGGGSGEHPAAVIDVHRAVGSFVMSAVDAWMAADPPHLATDNLDLASHVLGTTGALDGEQAEALDDEQFEELSADLAEALRPGTDIVHGEFAHWGGAEWIAVGKRLERFTTRRDLGPHGPRLPEHWIRECIGEYVLVSYTEMVTEAAEAAGVDRLLEAFRQLTAIRPLLLGVMAYPTGYEYLGGRSDQLGDGNVRH